MKQNLSQNGAYHLRTDLVELDSGLASRRLSIRTHDSVGPRRLRQELPKNSHSLRLWQRLGRPTLQAAVVEFELRETVPRPNW